MVSEEQEDNHESSWEKPTVTDQDGIKKTKLVGTRIRLRGPTLHNLFLMAFR